MTSYSFSFVHVTWKSLLVVVVDCLIDLKINYLINYDMDEHGILEGPIC